MPKENTTLAQQVGIASVAAVAEGTVNHPFQIMKIRYQTLQHFTWEPRVLYRGFFPSAASMIPITMAQMGAYHVFQNVFFSGSNNPWSNGASGFAAGFVPAGIACPVEMIMTNMKKDSSFVATAQSLINYGGMKHLFTGFIMTAVRDGIFTAGYLVAPDYIKSLVQPWFKTEDGAAFGSKIIAGVGAAVLSQPLDTVKTAQQSAVQSVQDAIKAPFKGGAFRNVRIVSAVCIMSTVKDKGNAFFKQRNDVTESNANSMQKAPSRGFSG